jgi:2-polyprenyl-3-methyl-5-hydroxy-6-metoxy-1,4-benzoquinol methylase
MAAELVKGHYERLLGPVYSWTVGDIDIATERADGELQAAGLPAHTNGNAVDLGAGFGLHSVPLARRGYSVLAIDNYPPLLQELQARAHSLGVRAVNSDLLQFRNHVAQPVDVILCMGDTLTHLPDAACVATLFSDVAATLLPGGVFIATFRDYVSAPSHGDARFILVRADDNRILSCFLEYSEKTVRVHDVLHERRDDKWQLRVSSYPKLRLAPEWAIATLASHGLSVRREPGPGGMVRVIARRSNVTA